MTELLSAAHLAKANTPLRGELRHLEPLARYTTWRVGGPAQRWYKPADSADLSVFLQHTAPQEALFFLGLGSNVLIRDGGISGTVIALHGALNAMTVEAGNVLRVEAGVPCARVARFAARHDLVGGEFLAGIPGTMGGALAMNAGAWGGETWQRVTAVETIDRSGQIRQRSATDYQIGYRHCQLLTSSRQQEWFVAAHLQFATGDGAASLQTIRRLLSQRNTTQPTGAASCGSVFRNPEGDYAARLIEAAGLKGLYKGGACVSTKHANFIINNGQATAADIEALIAEVATQVARRFAIQMQPEVRIVGARLTGMEP